MNKEWWYSGTDMFGRKYSDKPFWIGIFSMLFGSFTSFLIMFSFGQEVAGFCAIAHILFGPIFALIIFDDKGRLRCTNLI